MDARDTSPAPVVLFCIPHAGGGATAYRRWAEALRPAVELRVLQLAGRESRFRDAPSDDLDAVVADLLEGAEPHLAGPFAVFGHSMGGLLAFELVHEIRRRTGREPERLFVSATRPPQDRQLPEPLAHLSDRAFIAEIVRRYDGVPPAILQDAEYMASVLPALRADFLILERYRCRERPPLACPISVFGGRFDRVIPRSSLDAWAEHTTGEFTLDMLQGEHFFLQEQRLALAETILARLRRAARGDGERALRAQKAHVQGAQSPL